MNGFKNLEHFPSYYDRTKDSIVLCLNHMKSDNHVKEAFSRDYMINYYEKKFEASSKEIGIDDRNCFVWKACKFSMKEAYEFGDDLDLKTKSQICSRMFSKVKFLAGG